MGLRELIAECLDGESAYAAKAPQNKVYPYSVWSVVSDIKDNALSGQCDLEKIRFDLNSYSNNYNDAVTESQALQVKLLSSDLFQCIVFSVTESVEDDGLVHRVRVDFTLSV